MTAPAGAALEEGTTEMCRKEMLQPFWAQVFWVPTRAPTDLENSKCHQSLINLEGQNLVASDTGRAYSLQASKVRQKIFY